MPTPAELMAATPEAPAQAPPATTEPSFFSTTTGRALVKLVVTAVISAVSLLLKDPAVTASLGSFGLVNTAQSLFRDLADPSIPN